MATRDKNESLLDGVINEVSRLTQVGRETAADWVQNVSPDAASLIRPEPRTRSTKSTAKRTTAKKAASKKTPVHKATTAARSTARKATSRPAHKSAGR